MAARQPLGGTAIKPEGWDRSGCEAFKYFLYNPDTGAILSRTPMSWAKIILFYCGRFRVKCVQCYRLPNLISLLGCRVISKKISQKKLLMIIQMRSISIIVITLPDSSPPLFADLQFVPVVAWIVGLSHSIFYILYNVCFCQSPNDKQTLIHNRIILLSPLV